MKPEHKELLRDRARRALADLYHNATVTYPRELHGRTDEHFESWFGDVARFEIEYLQDGGAHGRDYRATLAAPCNAGRFKSPAARAYYIQKGMRDVRAEREDCGALTGWRALELAAGNQSLARQLRRAFHVAPAELTRNDARWEYISDYGTLYTWGRGGRTLAPAGLIQQHGGGSFSVKGDYADELSAEACTRLIQILESFNHCVGAWCKDVPEEWRRHCAGEDAELAAQKKRDATHKAKETRERRYWEARDTATAA